MRRAACAEERITLVELAAGRLAILSRVTQAARRMTCSMLPKRHHDGGDRVLSRWIVGSQHLPAVQDVAQQIAFHAEPLSGFFDRQAFAHDQTYRRPINSGFVPIAFMNSHD